MYGYFLAPAALTLAVIRYVHSQPCWELCRLCVPFADGVEENGVCLISLFPSVPTSVRDPQKLLTHLLSLGFINYVLIIARNGLKVLTFLQ